jgi:hypothetical protein
MSLDWRLNNPVVTVEILRVLSENKRALKLILKTDTGLKVVWLSKKLIRIYHYHNGCRVVEEVELPEWLAKKTGLVE